MNESSKIFYSYNQQNDSGEIKDKLLILLLSKIIFYFLVLFFSFDKKCDHNSIYYTYFKPNISLLDLSKYKNRIDLVNKEEIDKNDFYNYLIQNNEINIIQKFLENNINILINDFNKEGKEYNEIFHNDDTGIKHRNKLCGFLAEIKKEIKNDKFNELAKKRINDVKDIDENN